MTTFLTILLVLAMLGVLGVFGMGVATMIRGGDPRRSNKLMQARVVMQGVALLVLVLLMLAATAAGVSKRTGMPSRAPSAPWADHR